MYPVPALGLLVCRLGGTVYLLTPFIGGGELFTWIADDGGAEEEVVRPIFRQIVDGMRVRIHT